MRHAKILTALIILSVALVISFTAQRTKAAGEAIIWVDPPKKNVLPGEVFNVSIQVDNLPSPDGAVGFQVALTWDPAYLTGLNTTEVLFHSVTPPEEWDGQIWKILDKIDNTAGFMYYAYTFQDWNLAVSEGYAPITGNHTLVTITFRGSSAGLTTLGFYLVKIGDVNANSIPSVSVSGEVTVGNPHPTITIVSPQNETFYNRSSVALSFNLSKPAAWIGYSLDEHPNITILGDTEMQPVDGIHSLVVYANDTLGQMGNSTRVFFVVDTLPPAASFAYSPSTPEAEDFHGNFRWPFTFNSSASTDATTGVFSYYWDFGDGNNATDAAPLHIYEQPGSYNVKMTVTDFVGNSATQAKTITIEPASKPLEISYGLIVAIIIPVVWTPALLYYFSRTRRTRPTKRKY